MRSRLLGVVLTVACAFACGAGGHAPSSGSVALDGSAPPSPDSGGQDGGSRAGARSTNDASDAAACPPASLYVAPSGTGTACTCVAPCALEIGRD